MKLKKKGPQNVHLLMAQWYSFSPGNTARICYEKLAGMKEGAGRKENWFLHHKRLSDQI